MTSEATSRHVHAAAGIERAPTGVEGLDLVLGGGLIRGGIYLVMGRPGTGKTTLANQLCFAHVAGGGRAVYVTLLAESHASMMKNLQTMQFFDPEAINRTLMYVGAYRALRDEKLKGLLGLLRQVIRDERASLLVLDGVSPTRALAGSDLALKEFIVELQMLGSMTDCTTLLFANMDADDANGPEHTMVDGLVELAFERTHRVTRRTLEVIKFRGSRHLLGKHELSITDGGVVVHPRTEDVVDLDARPPAPTEGRVGTGLPRLDAMLGGGVIACTTTLVLGFTGSGKTTLATHFLSEGAAAGESCFYFGFYESPARLLDQADAIGLELSRHAEEGRFFALWQPPYRYGLDALAERLLGEVRNRKVKRLVIDGLDGYRQSTIEPSRTIRYLTALSNELRSLGVTTLATDETTKPYGPEVSLRIEGTSSLVDNLVMLEYLTVGTELRRLLSVVKQRGSAHATNVREFALTSSGLELASDATSAESLLSQGGDSAIGRRNRGSRTPSDELRPRPAAPHARAPNDPGRRRRVRVARGARALARGRGLPRADRVRRRRGARAAAGRGGRPRHHRLHDAPHERRRALPAHERRADPCICARHHDHRALPRRRAAGAAGRRLLRQADSLRQAAHRRARDRRRGPPAGLKPSAAAAGGRGGRGGLYVAPTLLSCTSRAEPSRPFTPVTLACARTKLGVPSEHDP